ncbi:MAG: D-2-hydroxyacid dehydrogenase, partial [Chloroflexi bacterium]|nr:D-2-hydroxyacid dehydrogenase [Chloroflexota bacterium]
MGARVAVIGDLPTDRADELRRTGATLVPASEAADALVAWDLDVPAILAYLAQHTDLRWVHLRWAGVPTEIGAALVGRSTVLTNGSGAHGIPVAEYVAGVILQHYKRFGEMRSGQTEARWLANFTFRELRGSKVGIVGLGDLGLSIARVLLAFGVELRGLRRSGRALAEVASVFTPAQLHAFLDHLDVLVVAAPLTAETIGLIGPDELACLAPGALLVNVGRAAIVDENALVQALESGQLGGAALDVFATEPLPPGSRLWRVPNVFISPHCADATPQSLERGFHILKDNLERF